MKTSYDSATDSLYIHLTDHASVDSVELTDGLVSATRKTARLLKSCYAI